MTKKCWAKLFLLGKLDWWGIEMSSIWWKMGKRLIFWGVLTKMYWANCIDDLGYWKAIWNDQEMLSKVVFIRKNRLVGDRYVFDLVENVKKTHFLRGLDKNVLRQLYWQPRILKSNMKWPRSVSPDRCREAVVSSPAAVPTHTPQQGLRNRTWIGGVRSREVIFEFF